MTRIGPKMEEVQNYVHRYPGCTMLACAEWVGPNGSRKFGYAAVHRALDAGLVRREERKDKRGCYRLYPVD